MITAKEILGELDSALKAHGTYWYEDKSGWHDIVTKDMTDRLRQHTPAEMIAILKEVASRDEYSARMPDGFIHAYDDDDELWEALCAVDEDFVGEHY